MLLTMRSYLYYTRGPRIRIISDLVRHRKREKRFFFFK